MKKEKKEEVVNAEVEEVKEVKPEVVEAEPELVSSKDEEGIIIADDVIAQIASIAAQEVKGVAAMGANGLGEMVGIKTKGKGIKVSTGTKDLVIDVAITVEYGGRIPDICYEVQKKVESAVETQTGINVVAVNVRVQGINIPKKKNDNPKGDTEEKA